MKFYSVVFLALLGLAVQARHSPTLYDNLDGATVIDGIDRSALEPQQIDIDELNVSIPGLLVGQTVPANTEEVSSRIFINTAENAQITFKLYTSATDAGTTLDVDTVTTITGSNFDGAQTTIVLVHSYMPNGRESTIWYTAFRAAIYTRYASANVIEVDWQDASTNNYYQASTNAALVASRTGALLVSLRDNKALVASNVHMFGHGVGAHICGISAATLTGVSKITAFDPVGRQFLLVGNDQKLDADDATFVEVYHTDDTGMGNSGRSGNVDIYFNGGATQPGIAATGVFIDPAVQTATLFFGGATVVGQAHFRGIEYYQETITNAANTYSSFLATNYDTFLAGNSFDTSLRLGFDTDTNAASGSYYASTLGASPYLSSTNNYCTVRVGTTTRRFGGTTSLTAVGLPTGSSTSFKLEPENAILGVALTSGTLRSIIVLPDGQTQDAYTYRVDYAVSFEGSLVIAPATLNVTGVTITNAITANAVASGNCNAFSVTAGTEAAAISLTSGTTCADAEENLDALTITLIAVAASVATVKTVGVIIKFKQVLKGLIGLPSTIPLNPLSKLKSIQIIKAGIGALVMVKDLSIAKIFIVSKLVKGIAFLPVKVGILGILTATAGPALKVAKLVEFLKDISGLDADNFNVVKIILGVLNSGDNDSLVQKIIGGIVGALKIGFGR